MAPEAVLESDRASVITGSMVARAWRDAAFRARLVADPKSVLVENGLAIPERMSIRIVEDTPEVRHISLTRWTSEPSEIAEVFRGLLPLPAGIEVRLVQNTEDTVWLVVPVAPQAPEEITDPDRLRKLAPRASVFAAAESIVTTLATEFGSEAAAAAAATAHVNTETETATATATAFNTVEGVVSGVLSGGGSVQINGPGVTIVLDGGVEMASALASASASSLVSASASASESASVSASASGSEATSVYTQTSQEVMASETVVSQISVGTEAAVATVGVEAEAVATTTTVGAEAEVVAVGVIVLT